MRARFVISAAILVGAAMASRHARADLDAPTEPIGPAVPAGPTEWVAPVEPAHDVADAPVASPAPPTSAWPSRTTGAPLAPEPVPEPVAVTEDPATAAPEDPPALNRGRFALGGHALVPGHMTVSAVSFAARGAVPAAPEAIRLEVESIENVPDGGLVVLADPGFAPDAEGFTLMLAAAAPGRFAASGWYELVDQDERTGDARVLHTGGCSR